MNNLGNEHFWKSAGNPQATRNVAASLRCKF